MGGGESEQAIHHAPQNGAMGAAFYDGGAFTEEHFETLKKAKKNF